MVRGVKRRQSSTLRVRQLLSAIAFVRQQKQISNHERISKYMQREHGVSQAETEKQLHYGVKEQLINSYTIVGSKGSKTGIEQEGFKFPDEEDLVDDGHDWYCFECHTAGEVLECTDCFRVYHTSCVEEELITSKFTCSVCQDIEAGRAKNKMKRKLLNTLLSYTVVRLKEKTRELHKIGHREEEQKYRRFFVYKDMDLNTMEQKVQNHKYRCLEEYLADAHLILHNVHLIYGDDIPGGMTELARIMIRDCKYDLDEIKQCHHCYYMSNAKPEDWFIQPCDPPHQLVYAKQKGFSYWPAKVIRQMDDNKSDVRFFGGHHQRALLPEENIRPIDTNIKELIGLKRTHGFMKASAELQRHQQLLKENQSESEKSDSDDESDEMEDLEIREVTSSVNSSRRSSIKTPTPDDTVTSSEDKIHTEKSEMEEEEPLLPNIVTADKLHPSKVSTTMKPIPKVTTTTVAIQTSKKISQTKTCGTQSDKDNSQKCSCKEKHEKQMEELKERLEKEHKIEIEKTLKDKAERLQKDFNEDKQQAVARAMGNTSREVDRIRRQVEEKCKEQYMEEMKKLAQKHKEAISQTKKKQWCFNCEEEAMYHCCWNTSYCSLKCQQEHWHKEHKKICRRKR